jgi:hypothetical protein
MFLLPINATCGLVVTLGPLVIEEFKRIIRESEVTKEDDAQWPPPDKVGCQELEVRLDDEHIAFTVSFLFNHFP